MGVAEVTVEGEVAAVLLEVVETAAGALVAEVGVAVVVRRLPCAVNFNPQLHLPFSCDKSPTPVWEIIS